MVAYEGLGVGVIIDSVVPRVLLEKEVKTENSLK